MSTTQARPSPSSTLACTARQGLAFSHCSSHGFLSIRCPGRPPPTHRIMPKNKSPRPPAQPPAPYQAPHSLSLPDTTPLSPERSPPTHTFRIASPGHLRLRLPPSLPLCAFLENRHLLKIVHAPLQFPLLVNPRPLVTARQLFILVRLHLALAHTHVVSRQPH